MLLAHTHRTQRNNMRERPWVAAQVEHFFGAAKLRTISTPAAPMKRPYRRTCLAGASFACVALSLQGCSVTTSTVNLAKGPEPVELTVTPGVVQAGSSVQLDVVSPSADSILVESVGGLDRFSDTGGNLTAKLPSDFGETGSEIRYAVRQNGRLFNVLKKPMKVSVCRENTCREYFHELAVQLPERNVRSVAVTGGWSTAFTRRTVTARDKSVLLKEAINHSVWNLQAELATGGLNARVQGFYGADEKGGSLDVSHEIKRMSEGVAYGLAMPPSAPTPN